MKIIVFQLTQSILCLGTDLKSTCGDEICVSPEYFGNCASDCGEVLRNPNVVRKNDGSVVGWSIQPVHLQASTVLEESRNVTLLQKGGILHQNAVGVFGGAAYTVLVSGANLSCLEVYMHDDSKIFHSQSAVSRAMWRVPAHIASVSVTIRANCDSTVSFVSLRGVPESANTGWKYYEIVDAILGEPERIDAAACRDKCLNNAQCCAWQVCPGTEAEGCGGCYNLGRAPGASSAEWKEGWFAAIERSIPEKTKELTVTHCREWLLRQSAHDKDFYDSGSGKLQKYVNCASLLREDRTVPKQIFVGGVHIPTILVANHRTPDPRFNPNSFVLPHFYLVPFYDTNIGNIMKQTSAMNIVQSYEMQSILSAGDVFIDVGANLGSYTVPLAERVGPSGMVFAFEPFRWLFQFLSANIALNGLMNVWAFQLALGDKAYRQSLLQPNLRFFSSPGGVRVNSQLEVSEDTKKQLYDIDWGPETVDTWTLDEVVFEANYFSTRNRDPQIDLIKIDVEGMEISVINGSHRILKQLKPIVWVENVDFFELKNLDFINLMASLQYTCWKSLNAGNDLICEPLSGERSDRLGRVSKAPISRTDS